MHGATIKIKIHVASLPVKLCGHHKLVLKLGKLTGRGGPKVTRMDARTPRGCECESDDHSDCTRSGVKLSRI